ncbi:fimbrial protein [Pseudenterobacter timonensis]|uniref:Fimbrial protein n=1 Tax=Pseudenterobacter timonensis TaxID=1755099 RepID=A0AAE4IV74_9ENTR|nr:fimbrial protein [Pseudenterobacter timonensis]MDR9889181.1 fimbrial protein [Pseudenterobacter timonensis]
MKQRLFTAVLVMVGSGLSASCWATCYRITGTTTNSTSAYYTEPGKGTAAAWDGMPDQAGSTGSLPTVVNINNTTFQPNGTLLATGIVPMVGNQTYNPEQILFRCQAADVNSLYEYYATNGDSTYGGNVEVGTSYGLPQAYQTYVPGMALRATNMMTGEYYSRYWKARQLTNLDKDSQGWLLVKAKNFSNTKVELFRLSTSAGGWGAADTGIYPQSQPATYMAFKGPGFSSGLSVGADSNSQYDGWYSAWPGGVNLYHRLYIRRSASCVVNNVTPLVVFSTLSVSQLQAGAQSQKPISISFSCQTGGPASTGVTAFTSGVAANQTAMGILVNPANAATATSLGLTSGAGVTWLLSDNYGTDPSVATGVGIQITRTNGTVLNLLRTLSGAVAGGNAAGWYPLLDDATGGQVVNGVTTYSKTLNATLKAIPGQTITAGKVNATAQIIIQVQ